MEKRLSTIVAITSAVITEIAVVLFLRDYWAITTVVLVGGVLLFRAEAVALIIGFLVALASNFWQSGHTSKLMVTIAILSISVLLQVLYFAASQLIEGLQAPYSSFGQNVIFAMIGEAIAIVYYFATNAPYFQQGPGGLQGILYQLFLGVPLAKTQELTPVLELTLAEGATLEAIRIWLNVVCAGILISPWVWGPLFAVLRQKRFNISKPASIIGRTLLVYLVNSLLTSLIFLPVLILGGVTIMMLAPWLFDDPPQLDSPLVTTLLSVVYLGQLTTTALFSAWIARWGEGSDSRRAKVSV
jgi:hypothetical protein